MRTDFSCCSLDGVQKGARTKVYLKHRYHKMACSMVYSKSLLMNVVKTFLIWLLTFESATIGTLKSANQGAGTSINQSDAGSAGSWHPQISKSLNWDYHIRCWVSQRQWVWKQTQPLKLSKLPRRGSKGLTVFNFTLVFCMFLTFSTNFHFQGSYVWAVPASYMYWQIYIPWKQNLISYYCSENLTNLWN